MDNAKAVATGNPKIREKMQLENDLQRLKVLKSSYDRQYYAVEDNIMINYPKQLAEAEERLACVRADMASAEAAVAAEPDFAITVKNKRYTERTEAGNAVIEAMADCDRKETVSVGKYKCFEFLLWKDILGDKHMILRGKTDHSTDLSSSPVGNMVKLENIMEGMGQRARNLEDRIVQIRRDMEQSKEEYEKPFLQEKELAEKTARLNELNAELDLETNKVQDIAETGEPENGRVAEPGMQYRTRKNNREGR